MIEINKNKLKNTIKSLNTSGISFVDKCEKSVDELKIQLLERKISLLLKKRSDLNGR